MVVTVGEAVGLAQLLQLKPADGVQVYDVAPPAVRLTVLPAHTVAGDGTTVTVGVGFTVMVTEAVELHVPEVPVIVYVVVTVGLAVTLAPVVVLNPVAGAQL